MSQINLGSLLINIAADTAQLKGDMGKAAQIVANGAETIRKTAAAAASALAGIGAGMSVGAFAGWIKSALDAQDKADELAQKIGLTTEAVSRLTVAAKFSATDLEGVSKAIIKLSQNSAAAAAGSKAQAAAFGAIGVSVTTASGQLKAGDQLLGEIADKFATYRDSAEKTTLAIGLFGKAGADMIPMLNEGKAALDDWGKMAEQFGLTISSATGKASAELADNIDKILFASQGLANTIAAELAPALAEMSREIVTYLRSDQWKAWLDTVRSGARWVAENLEKITGAVKLVGELAVLYIGQKFVLSMATGTINILAASAAMLRAVVSAGSMSAAMTAAGANFLATSMASVKAIGGLPLAMGAVTAAIGGWQIGTYLREQFLEARLAGIALVEGLLVGWERIKQGSEILWASVKFAFRAATDSIKLGLAEILNSYAGALERLPTSIGEGFAKDLRAYATELTPTANAAARFKMELIGINAETTNAIQKIRANTQDMAQYEIATQAAADAMSQLDGKLKGLEASHQGLKKGSEAYIAVQKQISAAAAEAMQSGAAQADVQKRVAEAMDAVAGAAKRTAPNVKELAEGSEAAAKGADALAAAQKRLADLTAKLKGELSPTEKAWSEYETAVRDAAAAGAEMIRQGQPLAQVQRLVGAAVDAAKAKYEAATDAAGKLAKVQKDYQKQIADDKALIGLNERARTITKALQQQRDAFESAVGPIEKNKEAWERYSKEIIESTGALYDQQKAMEESQAQAQRYGDIVRGAMESAIDATADWAVNGFKDAKNYWKGMVDLVKRAVSQMIAEWAKTKFMKWVASTGNNSIWANLFGVGAAALGSDGGFGSSGGGAAGSGGATGAAAQTVGGFMDNYRAVAGGNGGAGGGYNPMSAVTNYAGYYALGKTGAGAWLSSNAGAVGQVGAWGGALAGAYYGYQQGDGGIGTAGSTAAGAIAGYYAGTVAAGALLGASGAAAAGGAVTAGAASGAMGAASAVPIVGWIAALALIVDKVTGGAIFGSKYRPNELSEKINFNADGVTAKAMLNEWKYVSQGSQFLGRIFTGGALLPSDWKDMEFRNREIPVDPEMLKALQKVFDALGKTAKAAAKKLETDVAAIVDASFETKTFYDRKGKVERTETVGTILGKQYKEEWEQFQKRMHAEVLVATLAQLDANASAIAEAYRKNADELMDAAQTMVQAQADLQNNIGLLGAGDSLKSIMSWVEQQREGNETLAQTYGRLSQATAQYREILAQADDALQKLKNTGTPVDQMRAALAEIKRTMEANIKALNDAAVAAGLAGAAEADLAKLRELSAAQIDKISKDFFAGIDAQIEQLSSGGTPAADFALAMRAIWKQMNDNLAMANLVAQAAGKQGASEQQLARIHELAARQAAAAIAKLQDVAKQQARNLGYLGPTSVAEIDSRIAELQGRANAAAQAVQSFGGAMVSAAQDATNAIALLLGNLSPLNDQAKLAIAMQGLYAGTATQEQVLEIGRRLYASSAAYTALFEQVMRVRPRGQQAGGGGGGRQQGDGSKPLTPAEAAELRELRERRPEQLRRERLAEAEGFANTIAALAASQGISFQEVADKIGFSLGQLATDMGMTQDQLLAYLAGIDVDNTTVPDSITSNTDRLIAALNQLWGGARGADRYGAPDSGQDRTAVAVEGLRADGRERRYGEERTAREIAASNYRVEAAINRLVDTVAAGDNSPRGTRLPTPRQG